MSEKVSSPFEAIARALMPPPPGETEKKEVYEQAGRSIIELSNAENLLAVIFCILAVPVSIEEAKKMFASQGSLDRKAQLVNFMILHANKPEEVALWSEIYKEFNTHKGMRNLIAHQRMMVTLSTETPLADVLLMPLFHSSKGKPLRVFDIKSTADELEKVNAKLWKLVKSLGRAL
ncbi:hypothetical protein ACQR16_27770 [Bradyrhizobium oligotrophicum]|uniref:hypothetical protein n=1 Tax=Bradyrhizobium oligotrophicum TaxID=44255 RepID=UPI003EBC309A